MVSPVPSVSVVVSEGVSGAGVELPHASETDDTITLTKIFKLLIIDPTLLAIATLVARARTMVKHRATALRERSSRSILLVALVASGAL